MNLNEIIAVLEPFLTDKQAATKVLESFVYHPDNYEMNGWMVADIKNILFRRFAYAGETIQDWHYCPLSDDEMIAVLEFVNYKFDASIGINWDVLSTFLDLWIERNHIDLNQRFAQKRNLK